MPRESWEAFFAGPWLDVQRRFATEEDNRRQADLIERHLGLRPGSTVLDVPCGDGRLSLELASRGHVVTGVDFNEAILQAGRRAAIERGVSVEWECRDMRDLPWPERFDGAFCYWGSFGYFDEQGDVAFARGVAAALKPQGRFLIETQVVETLLPMFQHRSWEHEESLVVLEDRHWDHEQGRLEDRWTFLREGEAPQTARSSMRIYTYRELCTLLVGAGFGSFLGLDARSGESFSMGSRRLILVGMKG